jgi:putative membrane protein
MKSLNTFGSFFELWNPDLFLIVLIIAYFYIKMVQYYNTQSNSEDKTGWKQVTQFLIGLFLFYIAQGSPIHFIGHHYIFSLHMLQQSILFLIVPIFIWLGLPVRFLRMIVNLTGFKQVFYTMTRPLIALFAFNVLISIYHIPFVMDYLMRDEWMHMIYHSILFITAMFMWFPVFGQLPELDRLSELKKIGYIFANGILLTPACALIIFSNSLLYDTYTNVVIPFDWLSAFDDQQLGGIIMKIIQEIVYGISLSIIFFQWYRREREQEDDNSLVHP